MKYVFHIGERCQHLKFLENVNLLSGFNLFSGLYISFEAVLRLLKNNCADLDKNNVTFIISRKATDGVNFINCDNFSGPEIKDIEQLILANKFNFFGAENCYKDYNYSINLKYTDINNFLENDLYYWGGNYCVMPNADYSNIDQIDRCIKRKNRFIDCLRTNESETLLVYINKSILDKDCLNKMNYISELYDLPYKLFYVIPVYCDNDERCVNEDTVSIKNITFYTVYFPDNNFQKKNNPNDDNNLSYHEQYEKIHKALLNSYELNITPFEIC
jgi:hypothetical protein